MFKIGGQKISTQTVLLLGSDAILILIGLALAISLRFHDGRAILAYLHERGTVYRFALPVVTCELALYYHDVYNPEAVRRFAELLVRLLQALGTACIDRKST